MEDDARALAGVRGVQKKTAREIPVVVLDALLSPAVETDSDWSGRRLHFVGIGGAGMSGLALIAAALGAAVSGSDRSPSS